MVPARANLLRSSLRRAGAVALVAALVVAGTVTAVVVPAPGPAGADIAPSGPAAPAQGVLFGAHVKTGSSEAAQKSGVEALEAKLGRKLAIDHYYRPWTTTFPTTREQWDFDNGRIPMISWAKTYADQIAYGLQDDLIRQRADAIAALGRPLLIRWFWEMDGDRNLQYSESPALYIAAWQHIVSIFRQEGATNVGWVWCPNASSFSDGSAQQYYPGDDWVDWTCADGYDWYRTAGDNDPSFKTIFRSFYAWAVNVPKPMMVGEYGVLEAGPTDRKANWVNAARTALKTDDPAIDAVVYFNSYGTDDNGIYRDWTMDTSDSSLNAFALMGADPYFNGGPPAPTPDTAIDAASGPTGTVRATSAAFTFAASPPDPSATFGCRVDGGAFAACTSPFSLTGLADGPHTFEVRATTAGGSDPTAAARTWTVDTTGPTLTPLSPLDGATGVARDAIVSATFSEAVDPSTVSPSTVQLAGAGGVAVPAALGYSAANRTVTLTPSSRLAFNATYTVTVKGGPGGVADVLGNPMAADRLWRFTTVPPPPVPNTFLNSGPADPSSAAAATFTFSSDQPDAAFQCHLDAAAFADCSSPVAYTGLADGPHTFEVRAWTVDGGTDPDPATGTWRVDTTPPVVSATTPAAGGSGVALDATVTATFSEDVDPGTVGASTFSLRTTADGAAVAATVAYDPAGRTATLTPAAPLAQGTAYTVTVTGGAGGVADVAGNRMAADRVWGFSTWAPVPETAIDPASGPTGTVPATAASFTFSSDQPDAAFLCRLDGAAATGCTSPWSTTAPLADGPHRFEVTAWTMYGGADPDPAVRVWTVDTTPPAVSAVTPADGSTAATSPVAVRATFTEPVAPATVTASTFTLTNGAGAAVAGTVTWDAATDSAVLTPAAPLPGATTFTATVKGGSGGVSDPAGNPMAADKLWRFSTPAATKTATFTPVADARVEKAHPSTNYGGSTSLAVDTGKASYLRFTVSGLSGTVQSAKLRLYVTNGTGNGPAAFRTGDAWTEKGSGSITWKNRPAPIGAALDDKGKVPASAWVEFDVTPAVAGNGTVSFVLTGQSSDSFAAYSREQSGKSPQLVITAG